MTTVAIPKPVFRLLPFIIIIIFLSGAAAVFFSRAPVVLVTDASFNLLYGSERARSRQLEISLRLFRPMRTVRISEDAGPDLVAVSVRAAFETPYAVFFPFRYEAAALDYSEDNPDTPVAVLAGRSRPDQRETKLPLIRTDTLLDYYRAGRAAVLLAGESQGEIVFFHDGSMNAEGRQAFAAGLLAMDDTRTPLYLSIYSDYDALQNAACVLVNGSAAHYFEKNIDVPALLFSWIDPAMTPGAVKLIFDDSPWAVVYRGVRALEKDKTLEGGLSLASELVVLEDRFGDTALAEKVAALSAEAPPESSEEEAGPK